MPVENQRRAVLRVISKKDFLLFMGAQGFPRVMAVAAQCLTERGCVASGLRAKNAGDIMSTLAITVQEENPVAEITRILT